MKRVRYAEYFVKHNSDRRETAVFIPLRISSFQSSGPFDTMSGVTNPAMVCFVLVKRQTQPGIEIAPSGHSSTHTPHSMQSSSLMTAFPFSITIASTGHTGTHDSQPVHFSTSTTAAIVSGSSEVKDV